MPNRYAKTMFTRKVKDMQRQYGSLKQNEMMEQLSGPNGSLGEQEKIFIEQRDSFYLATANESGWPYLQHRGGPAGFLKVLDSETLAFADFKGNAQLISTGNLYENDKVSLFLMDYANRMRLKIIGFAKAENVIRASSDLLSQVLLGSYYAQSERIVTIKVEAFDWNCSQHIAPRYTLEEFKKRSFASHS